VKGDGPLMCARVRATFHTQTAAQVSQSVPKTEPEIETRAAWCVFLFARGNEVLLNFFRLSPADVRVMHMNANNRGNTHSATQ